MLKHRLDNHDHQDFFQYSEDGIPEPFQKRDLIPRTPLGTIKRRQHQHYNNFGNDSLVRRKLTGLDLSRIDTEEEVHVEIKPSRPRFFQCLIL